jgi:hypothetical protein
MFSAAVNSTPLTSINTTFQTTSGAVEITYLEHPPRTALTSMIVSATFGERSESLNSIIPTCTIHSMEVDPAECHWVQSMFR